MTTTTSGVDLPRLLPISTAHFATQVPQPLATHELMQSHETGLREWFVGMLGFVGLVALGGVYWIYYVRPALDVRHTTGRLRLSSALSLPRRSGLVLVDVEDQTVLVAMDSGGIRQVVPLGLWPGMKTTRRRAAADKAQLASSPSPSEGTQAPEELAFHDVYQDRLALGGAVRAVPSTARPEAALQTADAHSHKAA